LETGLVNLARAKYHVAYPAAFQLVAAMNPCPCGYLGMKKPSCRCSPEQVARYQGRISGPLWDRIDMQVAVNALSPEVLLHAPLGKAQAPSSRVVYKPMSGHGSDKHV
jgi:magnesium chelatase family protein